MAKNNYHVTKRENNQWAVKKENSQRASAMKNTQAEAEKTAKQMLAKQGGGEVVIHNLKGQFRDKDTVKPAKDPNPPKDKIH